MNHANDQPYRSPNEVGPQHHGRSKSKITMAFLAFVVIATAAGGFWLLKPSAISEFGAQRARPIPQDAEITVIEEEQ